MSRVVGAVCCLVMLATACAGDDAQTLTTIASVAPTDATTTSPPEPTTTAAPTTTVTTTTAAPTTSAADPQSCPDVASSEEDEQEVADVVLAAWGASGDEPDWEIQLGSRLPLWGVNNDEVVLAFPEGELVALSTTTCQVAWSLTLDPIIDLVVIPNGTTLVATTTELAGYAGPGFASWRRETEQPMRHLVSAGDVSVFIDGDGNLTGLHTDGGDFFFSWEATGEELPLVAIDTLHVYRAVGSTITARPSQGGGVVWETTVDGITDMLSVTGTLLVQTADTLNAVEPQDGSIRWTVPFLGRIAAPVVLDHGELHLASWPTTLWHLDPTDGSTVLEATAPSGTEWVPEMDDELVIEVDDSGAVTAINLLQERLWTITTGANRLDRVTMIERAFGAVALSLTFSGERF